MSEEKKKWEIHEKKERKNYKKSYKNFGASKLSMKFKDQNSKNPKKLKIPKASTSWWIQRYQRWNVQRSEEFKEFHSGIG